jgi:hypothetical protein
MIISASRRTDIPAFYAQWFINRVRAGYCTVPNPFNPRQVAHVPLGPEDVDVFVFWTRNPRPLFPYLAELDQRGYRYYFQYTLLDNPSTMDTHTPPLDVSLRTFCELAEQVGADKLIWRYDPIVLTTAIGATFHTQTYARIARALQGHTYRSVISFVDVYRKAQARLRDMAQEGYKLAAYDGRPSKRFDELLRSLVQTATDCDMEIVSCAETIDLRKYGVRPGKCVDDDFISLVFGLTVTAKKDRSQRKPCGCVISNDIGMYDSCLFGCQYCYATSSFERARGNQATHDPHSPSLLGYYDTAKVSDQDLDSSCAEPSGRRPSRSQA